jgi:molybdopterin synthase catalytic subunit
MTVKICVKAFEPWQEIAEFQARKPAISGKYGATSIFIGTMRDFNQGDNVVAMTLEHYPGMTEKQLEKIVFEARQQWQLLDTLVIHRVGKILPDEPIVAVAVWTEYRANAFDACRFIVEQLKTRAPFWKKELLLNNEQRWVSNSVNALP